MTEIELGKEGNTEAGRERTRKKERLKRIAIGEKNTKSNGFLEIIKVHFKYQYFIRFF